MVNWSTSLSSRQRVLLHAQPIMLMRHTWARDDDELRYDPLCLTMKLFDVIIDQSGFGNEVVRQTVGDALFPLLESLDQASQILPDKPLAALDHVFGDVGSQREREPLARR